MQIIIIYITTNGLATLPMVGGRDHKCMNLEANKMVRWRQSVPEGLESVPGNVYI